MKLSEFKPCAVCKGKIVPNWYVVRISQAIMRASAYNGVMGLAQMYGGINAPGALAVAEAMAPDPEVALIMGDEDKTLWTEINICQRCFLKGPVDLVVLMEQVRYKEEAADAEEAAEAEEVHASEG